MPHTLAAAVAGKLVEAVRRMDDEELAQLVSGLRLAHGATEAETVDLARRGLTALLEGRNVVAEMMG